MGSASMVCATTIAAGVNSQPKDAERAGTRQDEIDREPDHDRRQAEQRVGEHDQASASGKARHRQQRAERRADGGGDDSRGRADLQRQQHDREQLGIAPRDQAERGRQRLMKILHRRRF